MKLDREDVEMLILLPLAGALMGMGILAVILFVAWLIAVLPLMAVFALIGAVAGVLIWTYVMLTTGKPIEKEAER